MYKAIFEHESLTMLDKIYEKPMLPKLNSKSSLESIVETYRTNSSS